MVTGLGLFVYFFTIYLYINSISISYLYVNVNLSVFLDLVHIANYLSIYDIYYLLSIHINISKTLSNCRSAYILTYLPTNLPAQPPTYLSVQELAPQHHRDPAQRVPRPQARVRQARVPDVRQVDQLQVLNLYCCA